ncbi:MAG: non-hydrolyzing UDP-N-acetylglucosamine 2-epimerase [Bacteroidota bacterium]
MMKIFFVFGTRPEVIKLAPLIIESLKYPEIFDVKVCLTGQHKEMVDSILKGFNIDPDYNLDIMLPNQTLAQITSRVLIALDNLFLREKPDMVLVQGDTSTVLTASLAAFYHKIPVCHVEAGLRTYDKYSPWPEEINRSMVSRIAELHFTPTGSNQENLIKEGIDSKSIFVTGNTVIDALFLAINRIQDSLSLIADLDDVVQMLIHDSKPYVLITGHRRENFGSGFENICMAIQKLSMKYPDVHFIYPVHLNPNVREPVQRILGGNENIHLIEPLGYFEFVYTMQYAKLILTDSGGIQEEAPSLGKPVLVMRENTERPEALKSGIVQLVGTNKDLIIEEASKYLDGKKELSQIENPYGDGLASKRIVEILKTWK